MKRSFVLLVCLCGFLGTTLAQANFYRTDSLSYENYLRMLDEESKIPLSDISDDQNPEHLKERIALYGKDRAAYDLMREGVLRANQYAPRYAADMARNAGLQPMQANVLEGVYRYFNDMELRMLDEIGPKKFVSRYIAATPKFAHLKILKEAKIREVLNRNDHIRYFLKYILPLVPGSHGREVGKEDFKCVHYVRMPLFTKGKAADWIGRNIKYPMEAQRNNWQGKIFVSFVVDLDGSVTDVRVVKSTSAPCLNQEAIRVVKTFPKFIPAWCPLHQCNVRRSMTVPINFQLAGDPNDFQQSEQQQIMNEMNRMRSMGAGNNSMR